MASSTLDQPVEYLKGVGPARAQLLREELGISTWGDLLDHYPLRYIDKTQFHSIGSLSEQSGLVQVKGILRQLNRVGEGRKKRLVGRLRDATGTLELIWFSGVNWLEKSLEVGKEYVAFGKINAFRGKLSIPHPEMEVVAARKPSVSAHLSPVYPSTDKLNQKGMDTRARRRVMKALQEKLKPGDFPENLPEYLIREFKFPSRYESMRWIHQPADWNQLQRARGRLKFEELFFLQLRLLKSKQIREANTPGYAFGQVGDFFHRFYREKLPFELTGAQKRVIKEIRQDLGSGRQMNRLLQGDVGSGKTIVGLMCMLMAIDNGFQACLMAPTEILAQQHHQSISDYVKGLGIRVAFLSGSVKGKARKQILHLLAEGQIHILIGTHALLEDPVVFKNLGLAITDEQHRFGVKQRARLWKKNSPHPPHILVMTATPIPRTLAMTLYGDLDVSVIDELPPGRKPIQTIHKTESQRLRVIGFMKEEIAKGRQVYVVYPLIEESETLDLKNLNEGYEALRRTFPLPDYQISIVHGRMKPEDKDFEMQRFVKGETQIMIATTVIEVGVNVPNASVMIIENTERFGLSQLHQLRGRVGRGAEQSYCILMTDYKLSQDARERIATMVRTNNGFEIADADLRLRGPGNIEGTQQSGLVRFRIADLAQDGKILKIARDRARDILKVDPVFKKEEHRAMARFLVEEEKKNKSWGRIS
jgi:ATP-dependent DNA helicase RecG